MNLPTLVDVSLALMGLLPCLNWLTNSSLLQHVNQKEAAVRCVAFSPNGKHVAAGGGWEGALLGRPPLGGEGFLKIYSLSNKRPIASFGEEFTNYVGNVSFLDDETVVTLSHAYARDAKVNGFMGTAISFFRIAPKVKWERSVQLSDANYMTLDVVAYHPLSDMVCYLCADPRTVRGSVLQKLDQVGYPNFRLDDVRSAIRRFSPDGKTLLLCPFAPGFPDRPKIVDKNHPTTDSVIRLHDSSNGKVLSWFDPDGSFVAAVNFSADSKFVALACNNQQIYLLTSNLKELIRVIPVGVQSPVLALAPNGRSVAIAVDANTVKVIETSSGKAYLSLEGHVEGISSLAFSPDGKTLAVGCGNTARLTRGLGPGCVRLWDVKSGKLQALLK